VVGQNWRFEPTVSAGKLPQTYALDRAATGTGVMHYDTIIIIIIIIIVTIINNHQLQ
jgi:hypothetical protein